MRVLHITSHLNVGGISSYMLSLSTALRHRGHMVAVASGGGALEESLGALGIAHWRAPLNTSVEFSPQVWRATRQLAERVRQQPVDVLHAHTRVGQVVAAALSRRLALPYVATWHGFFRPNLGRGLWPCIGDLTIAISQPVAEHLERTFHVPRERIRLIPHGIDPAPFESPADPVEQRQLRDRLHLAPGTPVIGTVTRLVASKGIDQLLRILPAVRRAVPEAQVLIVGDGEERAALERLAADTGISGAVHFAGTLAQTRTALSLMDVFVFLPAEQEGFGLVLLEAMASGRPIVSLRRGLGAPWVLERSGVGLVVDPGRPEALAEAVVTWLRDGEAARRAGAQAREAVKAQFSLTRMAERVEAAYREVTPHA